MPDLAKDLYEVTIMGSGPAGLTAAIYTARANLEPVVFEGPQPGGQLTITTDVENYPGFREGIMGPDLMNDMRAQAERFGTEVHMMKITDVDTSQRPYKVTLEDGAEFHTKTLIIASGARARLLGLEAEDKLMGHGVSTCATCDGFFFRGKELAIVGGGDSAMEEATFLTKFATKVTVIHRRDELRASQIMQQRAFKNDKVEFLWSHEVVDIEGTKEDGVSGLKVLDRKTEEVKDFPVDGLFIAIGHIPNTEIFKGELDMDESGYILTKPDSSETNIPGIFATGDVQDFTYRQAITAAGSGCKGAIDAERYLEAEGDIEDVRTEEWD
ncbi:MAG: thioredoxin-disulfide reductase [Myxococcota bacterium]